MTEAAKTVPATPYPIHLFGIPPEAVSGVIIGARATPETVVRIRAVLAGPEWRHVRLVRALPDSKHFHLQLIEPAPLNSTQAA